jgi:hypothetical protein
MTVTMIQGARSTGNILADQRKIDMSSRILELEPNAAPLTVLTKMLNKQKTGNPEFSGLEDEPEPRFDAVNNGAGYTNSATSVVVDNGPYFRQDFLVKVTRTGEVMRVSSVSTNTLTLVRGIGGGAAALVDNDELLIVGVATPEGDTSRTPVSTKAVKVTNYCEIFRDPFQMTGTAYHSEVTTNPHDWEFQANKKGREHAKSIEYALWLGKPSEDVTDTEHPRRTTGGVFHFATSNITDAGGAFTEAELWAALRPVFRYSSDRRVAFCSMLAVDVMQGFPRGKLHVTQSEQTYGLNVMKFVSPHGELRLITHKLFEGTVYSGYIAILDMDQIQYRYLANEHGSRDTHINRDIQENDRDGKKDEYLTEAGLQFGMARAHGLVTGITS